jgi:hypothetical protein
MGLYRIIFRLKYNISFYKEKIKKLKKRHKYINIFIKKIKKKMTQSRHCVMCVKKKKKTVLRPKDGHRFLKKKVCGVRGVRGILCV